MVEIHEIPPDQINYNSPNIRSIIDESASLAASMEAHGQLEPGTGWWENGLFRIATGHRRADACRHLNRPFLARVIEPLAEDELVEYQLVENIQSEALAPYDLEHAVARMASRYPSHKDVGDRIGKSSSWVSTILTAGDVRQSLTAASVSTVGKGTAGQDPAADSARIRTVATSSAARFGRLKDGENRQAAWEEALRRNSGREDLPRNLVDRVVEEFQEREVRDPQAYIWKLQQERAKLVRKRADIEAEIDRIDARIARLSARMT